MLNILMDLDPSERKRRAIENFLKRNGLTIAGVCSRAKMTPTTIYGFMNGKNNDIGYGTLERFAAAAGTTVSVLVDEQGLAEKEPQAYEAMPESIRQQLQPADIEIISRLPALDPSQKQMLSGMLKALPREPEKATKNKSRSQKRGDK